MTLHGPHQVAKQSRTISVPFSPMASSKSFLDLRLWTPSLPIVAVAVKFLVVVWRAGVMVMRARLSVRAAAGVEVVKDLVTKRELVSKAVRLSAVDARDIQKWKGGRRGDGVYVDDRR